MLYDKNDWFQVSKGVRKGVLLTYSTDLQNTLNKAGLEKDEFSFKTEVRNVNNMSYANNSSWKRKRMKILAMKFKSRSNDNRYSNQF